MKNIMKTFRFSSVTTRQLKKITEWRKAEEIENNSKIGIHDKSSLNETKIVEELIEKEYLKYEKRQSSKQSNIFDYL